MKEFEKQWEKNGGGICGKEGCEKYWREALEWLLDKGKSSGYCDFYYGCFYENEILEELEKE